MTTVSAKHSTPASGPDLGAIKARQQASWASGDYAVIGTTLSIVGESLCESVDLRAGQAVLDVACGNGAASLAAARRFCKVTGLDYVPSLLARAEERARAERLDIAFVEGDAEALPFLDRQFDAVISTFGVMFTPDHTRAAAELARVVRPGGRIGLASWTPDGFVGQLFALIGRTSPPPAGLQPPPLWGTIPHCERLFDGAAASTRSMHREFSFRYLSAAHFIDVFRRFYGPMHKLYAALPEEKAATFTAELTDLIGRFNRSGDETVVIPSKYLEIVLTRS
ncbi:MAG TPA: class I SAM-dependent methyltransferase [Myxococcaceae bacterium]|nr:class I SAM-dependent methyltransferase [Myxococcaceae bacterium]